jgi:hypothetical protein
MTIAENDWKSASRLDWYQRHQVRFASDVPSTVSKTSGVERSFCADCGTSISYADDGSNDEIWLTIGMVNPERFEPRAHKYPGSRRTPFRDTTPVPASDGLSKGRQFNQL